MSEYDLFAGLSEVEEKWILQPRKLVSLRMNLLLCLIAANVSALVPARMPAAGVLAYLASYAGLYLLEFWRINRPQKRKLLIETDTEKREQ